MTLKFGLALPYFQTRNIALWAQEAEEHGWDGLFLGDAVWCEDPMIGLSAAAMATNHIRLGTMVIPVPLRRPWKIASESVALDHLSEGRLILGLGKGATWMGWQGFPDEVIDNKIRAEMLEETIDILSLMYQGKPFDFEGNQYHIKLTLLDKNHFPPKPIQLPRIPLWIPAIWPHKQSIKRSLKCDGIIVEKRNIEGKADEVTPDNIREIKQIADVNRTLTTNFDIILEGKQHHLEKSQQQERFSQLEEAGLTWWIESLWDESPESVSTCIQNGPTQQN